MYRLFLSLLIVGLFSLNSTAQQINILTGVEGGSYSQMGNDIAKICPMKHLQNASGEVDTVECVKITNSDGSYYNFTKINRNDVDAAFMQFDVLLMESEKDLNRKFKQTENVKIIMSLGDEEIHIITLKESGIKSFKQLKNKDVGIGSNLQGSNVTAKFIKEKTKMKWNDCEIPYEKAFRELLKGNIDAFIFVGKAPVQSMVDIPSTLKSKLAIIPIEDPVLEEYYNKTTIKGNTYPFETADVATYGVPCVLVTSTLNETPEHKAKIKELTSLISNNLTKLQSTGHEGWKKASMENKDLDWDTYGEGK